MDWGALASITIGALGQPSAFFRNGVLIAEQEVIYQKNVEFRKNQLRDFATTIANDSIKTGDVLKMGNIEKRIESIEFDTSGGMKLRLEGKEDGTMARGHKARRSKIQ